MLIEMDAKRFIVKAIELERQIRSYDDLEQLSSGVAVRCPFYYRTRKQLVEIFSQINSVANSEGIGRDDLGADILAAAEETQWKLPAKNSKAVSQLAFQIKETFRNLCRVISRYSQCVDAVDPQLRNNIDLVQALADYETAWSKGKSFLLNRGTLNSLVSFSKLIEGLAEKYKEMKDKIESIDAEIFIAIPCIAVLKMLEDDDKSLNSFCESDIVFTELLGGLKQRYSSVKASRHGEVCSILETTLLDLSSDQDTSKDSELAGLVSEIKKAAIVLQRSRPTDWNLLMETAIGII